MISIDPFWRLTVVLTAIGICFSMTDVYRSEILAVVMQQIVDKPVLPVLFLRTVCGDIDLLWD